MQAPLSYDPFAPDVIADPYPWYRRLQDEAPLYRQEPLDFWVLSRHEDVLAGARAHNVLSSAESVTYARAPIPMMLTHYTSDSPSCKMCCKRSKADCQRR